MRDRYDLKRVDDLLIEAQKFYDDSNLHSAFFKLLIATARLRDYLRAVERGDVPLNFNTTMNVISTEEHQHDFIYGGVQYRYDRDVVTDFGAHRRHYFIFFYCRHCTDIKLKPLFDESDFSDRPVKFNATLMAGS